RDGVLQLTADNAEVGEVSSATTTGAAPEADPAFLLPQWQDSVVALWTSDTHASGFVIDAKGLIATNQRVIGAATSVEVQLTTALKVKARVLTTDPGRDVAVLWIDPAAVASVRPVPLGCAQAAKPPVVDGQKIFAIGAPLREQKGMTSGTINRVEPQAIAADLRLPTGRAGSLSPYQMSSSDFDISLITPVLTYSAQYQLEQAGGRERRTGTRAQDADQPVVRPLIDFSNWSEYVADFPSVLLVRVTPKLV